MDRARHPLPLLPTIERCFERSRTEDQRMSKAYACIWPEVRSPQGTRGAMRADWGSLVSADTGLRHRALGG